MGYRKRMWKRRRRNDMLRQRRIHRIIRNWIPVKEEPPVQQEEVVPEYPPEEHPYLPPLEEEPKGYKF